MAKDLLEMDRLPTMKELKEFFNCEIEINQDNAELIWDWCNDYIKLNGVTPQKLIEQSNVSHIFTTNEIFDDLTTFEKIAQKACKSAIKAGDKLSDLEIQTLTEQLKNNLGLKCPHGRPVAIKITRMEIDKWFKRIV